MNLPLCKHSRIAVIGPPGSGKESVGVLLAEQTGLPLYTSHTFFGDTHIMALGAVMDEVEEEGWIVAGMFAYRFIRRGERLGLSQPDVIIDMPATREQIRTSYKQRGKRCTLKRIVRYCEQAAGDLDDYMILDDIEPGIYIRSDSPIIERLIGGGPSGRRKRDSST